MKKPASTIILFFLFLCLLVSLPQIRVLKAESTINIREDGSIEGTDKIQREGNVYTFITDAVIDSDIVVQRSNIVIDGNGHMLQNARLVISGLNNVTAKNMYIKDDYYGTHDIRLGISGIDVKNSSFITIMNNTVTGTTFDTDEAGIRIAGGNSNVIVGNTIAGNQKGLTVSNKIDFETFIPIEVLVYNNNFYNDFDVEFTIIGGSHIPNSTISFSNGTHGNFWYKYNGTDVNNDGIGDTPYVISTLPYFTDNYPLVEQYGNPIVEVPEFPSWIILPLFMTATLLAVILKKRKHTTQ